jgi:hypothetical protein
MIERLALPAARALVALLLLVFIPLIFHLPGPSSSQFTVLVAWVFLVVAALRLVYLTFITRPLLMDIAFWLFIYVFFGLAAAAQIGGHQYPLSAGDYTSSVIGTTQVRIAVGIAAYLAGRWLWARFSTRRPPVLWDQLRISEWRTQVVGVVGVVLAGALIATTGIKSFFESRDQLALTLFNAAGKVAGVRVYDVASKGAGGFKQLALTVPVFVVLVYLLASGLWRRHRILFAAVIGVSIITNNPISNARYWTGVVVAGLLAALMNLRLNSRHVYFALGLLLSTVFSLSYLNLFRDTATAPQSGHSAVSISTQLTSSPDYGMFQQELNGTLYVASHGFTHGQQIAGAVLVYVPHAVWPGKPGATGTVVEQEVGLNEQLSSSLWTEFYIDFGYPELIVGFILVGWLFAYLDNVFRRSTSLPARLIIPIAATYATIFLRGSLQPTLAYGVPIFVVLFLCCRRDRTPAEGAPAPAMRATPV